MYRDRFHPLPKRSEHLRGPQNTKKVGPWCRVPDAETIALCLQMNEELPLASAAAEDILTIAGLAVATQLSRDYEVTLS